MEGQVEQVPPDDERNASRGEKRHGQSTRPQLCEILMMEPDAIRPEELPAASAVPTTTAPLPERRGGWLPPQRYRSEEQAPQTPVQKRPTAAKRAGVGLEEFEEAEDEQVKDAKEFERMCRERPIGK